MDMDMDIEDTMDITIDITDMAVIEDTIEIDIGTDYYPTLLYVYIYTYSLVLNTTTIYSKNKTVFLILCHKKIDIILSLLLDFTIGFLIN